MSWHKTTVGVSIHERCTFFHSIIKSNHLESSFFFFNRVEWLGKKVMTRMGELIRKFEKFKPQTPRSQVKFDDCFKVGGVFNIEKHRQDCIIKIITFWIIKLSKMVGQFCLFDNYPKIQSQKMSHLNAFDFAEISNLNHCIWSPT